MAICTRCTNVFTPKRSDAKYCSPACRQAAYTQRQTPDTDNTCAGCGTPTPPYRRADPIHCCTNCQTLINTQIATHQRTAWQAAFDLLQTDPDTFFATWAPTEDGTGYRDPASPFVFRAPA